MFNHEFGLEIKSTSTSSNYYSKMMALLQLATDPFTNEIDGDLHPCSLSSKASQEGNPTYEEAMNGPHRDGFHNAMIKELKTLTDMESWEVVKRVPWSNVLPSIWAFKLKRFPDGSLSKYKSRFCAGGHRQIEGVDFVETFAPVVNWSTVRLLLILSQVLKYPQNKPTTFERIIDRSISFHYCEWETCYYCQNNSTQRQLWILVTRELGSRTKHPSF
jgi:hypothetical protein